MAKRLDTLLAMKDGNPPEDLPTFQPALYDALLKLSRGYHDIRKERERLIARKPQLSTSWHAKRQRTLAARQEVIVQAIRVGRSLGDAFVWFFYRNDPALLQQHLRQPAPSMPPAGDGGEGELALIAAVRFFGDKYILFHGITTMFRLGDATLVDMETQRIVGIGELKTQRLGPNQLNMHFVASMQRDVQFTKVAVTPATGTTRKPSPKQQAQLDKQLARISEAAVAAERPPETKLDLHIPQMAQVEDVNELVKKVRSGRSEMRQVSPGLLLVAYAPRKRSLLSRLTDAGPPPKTALEPIPEHVKKLLPERLPNNMLLISTAFYSEDWQPVVLAGATPMLMWPLENAVQRLLVTGAVTLTTIFNPAHLFAKLSEQGWSLRRCEPPSHFSLKCDLNGKTLELHRVEYFLQLISHSLYAEGYVLRIISETLSHLEKDDKAHQELSLDYSHHVFY